MIENIVIAFLIRIVYPLALEIIRKREMDPEFRAASDKVFIKVGLAETTAERRQALKELHELQKS